MSDKSKSKALLKGTGIYAIGEFGTKILSFLIVPLYTYYIATEDMGFYDILMSTIQLLAPLITMQISDAAYRWIIRNEGSTELYIRTTLQVLLTNCTIAFILTLITNALFPFRFFSYFAVLLVLTRIFSTTQKLLRALKKQMMFAVSGIIYSVIFLTLNVIQICILKMGIKSLFISAIVADITAIVILYIIEPQLHVNIFKKPDFKVIKEFYKYSAPLVPNYLNWWVINSSDRYIVAAFINLSANGVLAIAHKFPTVLQTILSMFTTSWQDQSVAEKEDNIGEYYSKVFTKYYELALSGVLVLIPITKIIVYFIMSQDYKAACDYISFYYLGTVFQSFASFYGVGYLRSKKTSKAFFTSIIGAVVNATVNLTLIKVIGLQAASISTFVGFFVMWLIREKQNRNDLGIKFNVAEFTVLTLLSIIVSIVSIFISPIHNILLLVITLFIFIIFNKKNISLIWRFIKSKIQKPKFNQH